MRFLAGAAGGRRNRVFGSFLVALLLGLLALPTSALPISLPSLSGLAYTVNSTADPGDGTCDVSHCSLREAIDAAISNPGSDTIKFNIPLTDTGYMVSGITGTWTISLTASLPTLIGGGTVISGTTQAGFIGGDPNPYGPEIEIAGAGMASGDCLYITSASNVIHGLVINRCPSSGIRISGSSATTNTISGNYIGTDASGALDLGNYDGVSIHGGAQDNIIGGDSPGERNIISGNNYNGVYISGSGTNGNTISGNYIGTDALGMSDLGNKECGVAVGFGAQSNIVGGDTPGERNVISGNEIDGVRILVRANGNTVSGNYIGTNALGLSDLGNTWRGVNIHHEAQNNTIGPDNIIAFNDSDGVWVSSSTATGNRITQNSIHSNSGLGIDLASGGNTELSPPTISSASGNSISGTAPANATVELFTGPDDEGKTYLATVSADGSGNWSAPGPFTLDTYVTATATDGDDNTSEFSTKVCGGTCQIFLPLIMKNY